MKKQNKKNQDFEIVSNDAFLSNFARGNKIISDENRIQNCVVYTRVSSKEQMDTNKSLDWQKKICEEYALKNKINIGGYFGGNYESAKTDERIEFSRMLKFVKSNKQKITLILVYSLDRFSRTGDSAIYISSELKKIGVNIIAVTSPTDTNSHAGTLQQNIQFIFGKFDNDLRRQKTIDGMREKLLRGEWIGSVPRGYSYVKGQEKQTIILNDDAELIKQAFLWRSSGITYEEIIIRLEQMGMRLPKQTLGDIIRNPFYCGYLSHNLLNGELAKGNHPALISIELFKKINSYNKTDNYKINKANDFLPLKVFVKDADSGAPFTGYLAKKKGLYYYKVNKVGLKINRSAVLMHGKFSNLLLKFTIKKEFIEPLKTQILYTIENLTESKENEKRVISLKLNELDTNLREIRKNHALGKIDISVYSEFSTEFLEQKKELELEMEKLNSNLSNHKEIINYTLKIASNLNNIWSSGNYYQKQTFQNTLFPEGLLFDAKNNEYRTIKINSVIGYIAELNRNLEKTKNRTFQFNLEKYGSVPSAGVEPAQFPTGV